MTKPATGVHPVYRTVPHEPADACLGVHCHIHHVDEPSGYRDCIECGHAYRSRWALRWERALSLQVGPFTFLALLFTRLDKITCCPLCAHDW